MDYDDAVEATVTRTEAQREIHRHAASWEEFVAEVGDRAEYTGAEVLGWLGY